MAKYTKQAKGSENSKGKGDVILPLKEMKGKVVKSKGKNVLPLKKKKVKGKVVQGERHMRKGRWAMIEKQGKGKVIKVPRSEVPKKMKNSTVPKVKVPRSEVPVRRRKRAQGEGPRSRLTLDDIIYARVSSSKQIDKAGFKRQ